MSDVFQPVNRYVPHHCHTVTIRLCRESAEPRPKWHGSLFGKPVACLLWFLFRHYGAKTIHTYARQNKEQGVIHE